MAKKQAFKSQNHESIMHTMSRIKALQSKKASWGEGSCHGQPVVVAVQGVFCSASLLRLALFSPMVFVTVQPYWVFLGIFS